MISVCIATFNGIHYLKPQLDSILSQLSDSDEMIISDDGSDDGTIELIQSYQDKRISLIHNERNHGFVGNFNNALCHVKGDYVFLSDQDDIWAPNKVEIIMNCFKNGYDLVTHNAQLIDGLGQDLGIDYFSLLHNKESFIANLWKTRFLGCCMCFRRSVLDKSLPIPQTLSGHDYWIGMNALWHSFSVFFLDECLIQYRRHGTNTSSSGEKSTESWSFKVLKRIKLLYKLVTF